MPKQQKPLISDYEVKSTSETRAELTKILAGFRLQGKNALPVLFGSHRKPEAVLVPVKLWKKIINEIDDLQLELKVSERMSNSQESEAMTYEQFAAEMQVLIDKKRALEDAERKKNEGL